MAYYHYSYHHRCCYYHYQPADASFPDRVLNSETKHVNFLRRECVVFVNLAVEVARESWNRRMKRNSLPHCQFTSVFVVVTNHAS